MRWRIRYQLLGPLLLLLLGVVGVSVWVAIDSVTGARGAIEARVRNVARTLSEAPPFPLVAPVLEQMKKLSGADYLLVGADRRTSTLAAEPAELPPAEAIHDDWRTLRLGPRVMVGGQAYLCSGIRLRPPRDGDILYILYPKTLWRDALWEALWPVLVLGGSLALASVLLAVVLGQRLSGRIQELERRTRLIAGGDFSPMPLPARDDEVRDLARSVNEMAQRLAQYEDAVRRTERLRLLGQVSGGLAHQLRNGLTGARLAVQVYANEQAGQTDTAGLEVALRQLTLLETNLKRFLDLGRQVPGRRELVSLTALVTEAVELMRPQCRHAGIDLAWKPLKGPATILGDAGSLGQVILNILTNAVEAAGPGGSVDVRMRDACCIEVWDSGPGPSLEIAERLFEPFVTGKPEGVGLGLAAARQAVEAHGGKILWRREEGQTCFRIELPCAASAA